MTERPDPLAPPPGYGVRPEDAVRPDLSVCFQFINGKRCEAKPEMVIWVGCLAGEHAGPMAFCGPHGTMVEKWEGIMVCGQCKTAGRSSQSKILKTERLASGIFGPEGDDNDAQD